MSELISRDAANDQPMKPLVAYERWLIGNEVQLGSRKQYMRVAAKVASLLPGPAPETGEDLRARVAALTEDQLLDIKQAVGWTTEDGDRRSTNGAATACTEINIFLKWGKCPHRVKVPRKVQVVRVPLSHDESERLLCAAGDHCDPEFAARNRAIVALLLEGALRRGRFNPLLEDLQLDEGYVVIRDTKSGDDWKVNLAPVAVEALRDYLRVRPKGKNAAADRWTFISQTGSGLRSSMAYDVVKKAAARAGIDRNVWPHLLRTTKLTDLAKQKVNPWDIKDHACHRNIQSLQPYMRMGDTDQHDRIVSAPLLRHEHLDDVPMVRIVDDGDHDFARLLAVKLALGEISEEAYQRALDAIEGRAVAR